MGATVMRDGDRVWLEGVKGFSTMEYADSVHGSQARILQTLGEPLTYRELICYSGFAFRIEVNVDLDPGAGHPCLGYVCVENGRRALPWKTRVFDGMPGGRSGEAQAALEAEVRAAVRESVDRGIPVHYGCEEDGLIVGYAEEGRRWWCIHPYHKWGAEPFWHDEVGGFAGGAWPWSVEVWTEPKPPEARIADRDLALAALRQAVEMWETRVAQETFLCGDAAYEHWLGWLRGVDAGEVENPRSGTQGNGWCFDVLTHSRPHASRWLAGQAEVLGGEAQHHLLIASDHYAALALGCLKDLQSSWDLAPIVENFEQWTREMRQEQIRRLEAARNHDRAAISEIRAALSALG